MDIEKEKNEGKEHTSNGWSEWSKYVLKELERLSFNQIEIAHYMKEINNKFENLPCKERVAITESVRKDVGWVQKIMWTICVIGIPSIIGLAVAWGGVITTITRNTGKIETTVSQLALAEKDIVELKTKSYGYRDIPVVVKQ